MNKNLHMHTHDFQTTRKLSCAVVILDCACVHVFSANCQNLLRICSKLCLHSYSYTGAAVPLLYTNPQFNKQFVVFVAMHVVMRQMEPVCFGEVMTSGGLSSYLPTCCLKESKLTAHTQAVSSINDHHH